MFCPIKACDFQGAVKIGTWKNTTIPIFHAPSMHALNQLVGYVKHINAGMGTVLYRGQCDLYQTLCPSIRHDPATIASNQERLNKAITEIITDNAFSRFFGLKNDEICGWKLYQQLVIESALQHYGAKTNCIDFVDNHWTALWFGLYKWDAEKNQYIMRDSAPYSNPSPFIEEEPSAQYQNLPPKPMLKDIILDPQKIDKISHDASVGKISKDELIGKFRQSKLKRELSIWKTQCSDINEYNKAITERENAAHLFLFLYVADTNVPNVHGLYLGNNSYTIDLRKTLPSTFLRPCSQHGWIVRGKDLDYNYTAQVACVIRMNVNLVKDMLGTGKLLSQENFFPNENIDQGYRVLLERQKASRLSSRFPKVLPPDTITDFYQTHSF